MLGGNSFNLRPAASWWLPALFCCAGLVAASAARDAPPSTPVILISIDTLRADHLSAYGYSKIHTPHLDSFAQGGTRFARAEAQIPLTLPSHTSLFTSTYPFQNRVEENGERVLPGAVTLASVLRAQGYKTAAFIGSDFLDKRFGLDQGFDVYDSPFNLEGARVRNPYSMTLRRDGYFVGRAARLWLSANRGQPVFAFVHLYDLHMPYDLHPGFRPGDAAYLRGASGYDAELAYVDRVLGEFREFLIKAGWWEKSLVVVLSDHGEGLGEHRESDHGYFIYESTLWVPLIVHWPSGAAGYPAVANLPCGLIDVAPTILDFLRLPAPASFVGRSLLGTLKTGEAGGTRPVYSESLYAHDAFGWAPLRSLRAGKYKLIDAPKAELFDLAADPREQTNLVARNSAVASELHAELDALLAHYAPAAAPPTPSLSPDTVAELESLGYLAAQPPVKEDRAAPDPKDRLEEYRLYAAALVALEAGRASAALPQFREILDRDPSNTLARYHLGECYLKNEQPEAARREWTTTLKLHPGYAPAAEALGEYWLEREDYAKARRRFAQVVALTPESFTGHFELGVADEHLGLLPEALKQLQAACQIAPQDATCARELKALQQKMK
jgi:arylsulfatase A-like enzyme